MAWKGRTPNQQDYNQLISALANSGLQQSNNALYQVIFQLVQVAQKNKDLTVTQFNELTQIVDSISNTVINPTTGLANLSYLTTNFELPSLPNSRQLLAGVGILFDDTLPGKRTISAISGGASYIPLSLGIEPLTFMSDGLGQPILVPFIP